MIDLNFVELWKCDCEWLQERKWRILQNDGDVFCAVHFHWAHFRRRVSVSRDDDIFLNRDIYFLVSNLFGSNAHLTTFDFKRMVWTDFPVEFWSFLQIKSKDTWSFVQLSPANSSSLFSYFWWIYPWKKSSKKSEK